MRPLMKSRLLVACFLCSIAVVTAQQTQSTASLTAVPKLVRFTGSFHPPVSQPAGMAGATLAIYGQQEGGTPLWTEDQNVELDANGNYTVLLGSTKNGGVPSELFAGGETRCLQVKFYVPGEVDTPRVLLVSVPYALKAADADTLGGKPASAYLLAGSSILAQPARSPNSASAMAATVVEPATTTINSIARFTSTTGTVGNSAIYQNGSNIGPQQSRWEHPGERQRAINSVSRQSVKPQRGPGGTPAHRDRMEPKAGRGGRMAGRFGDGDIAATLNRLSLRTGAGNTWNA